MARTARSAAVDRIMVIILGIFIVASGCMVPPAPVVLRVDPAALDDVRGIGEVQAELNNVSDLEDGGTLISQKMIIDVGGRSGRESLDKAVDLLTARKWVIKGQNRPTIVMMATTRWNDTFLALRPYNSAYFEDNPEVLKEIKKRSINEESLVYLDISRGSIG
ncbi:hypothetical protein AB0B45_46540 [Nonomuraea sp. NPDC049152]|uniref:hypothetical protein n=1 Tax=Nonomuraea sp. NPDC049152 TaxID=3154350 RepID=UPI0033C6B2F0